MDKSKLDQDHKDHLVMVLGRGPQSVGDLTLALIRGATAHLRRDAGWQVMKERTQRLLEELAKEGRVECWRATAWRLPAGTPAEENPEPKPAARSGSIPNWSGLSSIARRRR